MIVISNVIGLKGQCHEIFNFRYFAEIFAAQGALPVSLTPVATEKSLIRKVLIIFLDELVYI